MSEFDPDLLTQPPESPSYDGSTGIWTFVFNIPKGGTMTDWIPEDKKYLDGFGWHLLNRARITCNEKYAKMTLQFASSLDTRAGDTSKTNGQIEWDWQFNRLNMALEDHFNYLANWNYDLYQFVGIDDIDSFEPSIPPWWETAKNLNDADGKKYFWSRTKPADNSEGVWRKIKDRTKPGVENWIEIQKVAVSTGYFNAWQDVVNFMDVWKGGRIVSIPPEAGSAVSGKKWMYVPIGIDQQIEQNLWVGTVHYEYADEWDKDLYLEA